MYPRIGGRRDRASSQRARLALLLESPKLPSTKLVGRNVAKCQMGLAKAVNLFHSSPAVWSNTLCNDEQRRADKDLNRAINKLLETLDA